jgi:phosphopantetheine adenylyltransferase
MGVNAVSFVGAAFSFFPVVSGHIDIVPQSGIMCQDVVPLISQESDL